METVDRSTSNAAGTPTRSRRSGVLALAIAVTVLAALAGCGTERSVQAYCATFYGDGQKLRQQWSAAGNNQQDPFASMATIFSAPQDLANFFGKLDKVAPDDIEPDVASMQHAFQQQADSMGSQASGMMSNPLGTMAGALVSGMSMSGPAQRVDQYTSTHCGPPPSN